MSNRRGQHLQPKPLPMSTSRNDGSAGLTPQLRHWRSSRRRQAASSRRCPLWVISRHLRRTSECPLYPRKQTSPKTAAPSAQRQRATQSGRARLIFERLDFAFVGAAACHADRRTIERRQECSVRHIPANLVEERLKAKVHPCGRRRIMVRGQEKPRLE
jgi:hypothetical protein